KIAQLEVLHLTVPISCQLNILRENAAMNDEKSLDESQAAAGIDAPAANPVQNGGADLKRRRLLRGAAGVAPVVLTLRSGYLAASSCIPAIQTGLTTDNNNIIAGDTTGIRQGLPPPFEVCVAPTSTTGCPDKHIVRKTEFPSAQSIGVVEGTPPSALKCGTGPSGQGATNVAVLSAGSYSSFLSS
ncbi:MAG: hypothetical protein ACKN9T_08870, partial [Candidatus Methylumidiphilus sp.]